MIPRRFWLALASLGLVASLVLGACAPAASVPATAQPTQVAEGEDDHEEGDEHMGDEHEEEMDEHMDEHAPEEHMEGAHDVPDEAAAVQNPIEADEASISLGADLYASNCAVCHGETGEGDGPAAAALDPAPADMHEDHVQGLSDGGLFYIITHGRPETAMPAWEDVLDEEERWHVVNFLRTFAE